MLKDFAKECQNFYNNTKPIKQENYKALINKKETWVMGKNKENNLTNPDKPVKVPLKKEVNEEIDEEEILWQKYIFIIIF